MIDGHGDDTYKYRDIRLNFSSNIPTFVDLTALEEHLRTRMSLIRSYPEPSASTLEKRIADSIGKSVDEVMVTRGATEAIYLVAQCLAQEEKSFTVIHPTFSEYESACRMFGLLESVEGDVCWLCNPNNPTGEVFDEAYVKGLTQRHRWLVIDQSYEDYTLTPPNAANLPNVITLHSMTKKYCIPGLRLGYITTSPDVIALLRRLRRPWAVNALAIEAGLWLMEHRPKLIDMPAYLAEAKRLCTALNNIPGIHAHDTQTNFMLCTIEKHTAAELKDYLATRHGILIRDASNFQGLSPHHFRVAAQRPHDNDILIKSIMNYEL